MCAQLMMLEQADLPRNMSLLLWQATINVKNNMNWARRNVAHIDGWLVRHLATAAI